MPGRRVPLWHLALDEKDGPHLGRCGDCRDVVTIDSRTGEVRRNVEYYALAHARRFVLPGEQRIWSSEAAGQLSNVDFRKRDGSVAPIVAIGAQTGQTLTSSSATNSRAGPTKTCFSCCR